MLIDRNGTAPRYDKLRSITLSPHQYGAREHDIAQLQHACDTHEAAVFLSTYYTRPRTTPSVMLVYDLIPEALHMDLTSPMWQEKADAIAHANKFMAISKSTQWDLSRFYSIDTAAVTVTHCGVDPHFRPAMGKDVADFRDRTGLKRPYLLFVGSRDGYKNAGLLFSAMHQLPEAHQLEILFAGGQQNLERQFHSLADGVTYQIRHLSEDDLVLAYSGATALVYPTLYEGFGLPIVEAMACGCPVVACRTSSIPEIAQGNALYVPPNDPRALAAAITTIKDDAALRQRLVAGGLQRSRDFRWELMAEQMRRALREFLC